MLPPDRMTDDTDLLILQILQANARETQADIARAVGLAPSAFSSDSGSWNPKGSSEGMPRTSTLGLSTEGCSRSSQ